MPALPPGTAIMAPQRRLCTAITLLALVSTPRNTVGQRAGACDKAPCLNGGTCHESAEADGSSHRHLQDTCTGKSVAVRTEEINAQCCGADDIACAAGIPTSCDSGCAAAFLPFWQVSNNRACLHIDGRETLLTRPRPSP